MKHVLSILVLVVSGSATAAEISIEASACAQEINVSASDAKLSDVLTRLAEQMQFTLKFDPGSDRRVTFERRAGPTTVLRELLNGGNFMQINEPREICGGRPVIAQIWVLPRGEAVPYLTYVPESKATLLQPLSRVAPALDIAPAPRGTRGSMSDSDWQRMKQDYKDGNIAADPDTGEPIPIEEYRRKIGQKDASQ